MLLVLDAVDERRLVAVAQEHNSIRVDDMHCKAEALLSRY